MGLFDRLFRKKKLSSAPAKHNPNVRPMKTGNTPRTQPSTAGLVQVKGPQRSGSDMYNLGSVPQNIHQTQPNQPQYQESKLGIDAKRLLDESVAKISKTPVIPRREGIRTQPKLRKAKRLITPKVVQKQPYVGTGSTTVQPVVKKPAINVDDSVEPQLLEDTIGEEELFKKLAQWDMDLKEKVAPRKVKTSPSPGTVPKMVPKSIPMEKVEKDDPLKKRENELKKYEEKLRAREKKVQKMEDMNKIFSQIEDNELEQFSKTEGLGEIGVGAPTLDMEIKPKVVQIPSVGEIEPESEELNQPLKDLIFTNFIVGPSNRFAHDVALAVAKTPADAYNPLFIYSEVGLGKTHLLCAIGNFIKSKNPNAQAVYASSEKFTNELLDYLRMGEMEKFRTKYRNVDVLLIDDIQFIGGQEGTQEEFFHTFNALYNAHKQIVITSDRPPKNIAHLKDRLRSRFEGGLIVNIKPPDLGTRTMILHEKAENDGIYIPDEIINYVAGKVKSNVRTLIGVLNRVVAHSSLTDRELDTGLVDEVLKDILDEGIEIQLN